MRNVAIRSVVLSLVATGIVGCSDASLMGPAAMSLEVDIVSSEIFQVSFRASIANWDGQTEMQYRASACGASGDVYLCIGGPFVERTSKAERVVQPITWTKAQCGYLIVFEASLPNGESAELTHITCSRD